MILTKGWYPEYTRSILVRGDSEVAYSIRVKCQERLDLAGLLIIPMRYALSTRGGFMRRLIQQHLANEWRMGGEEE